MLEKKLNVAVIDSGIDTSIPFFKNKDILSVKIKDDNIVECNCDTNGHGSIVSSYILRECENISIVSIQILDENNKSKLSKLIQAINYCIANEIDVINLSLGINLTDEKAEKLRTVCHEATSKGILIFAAHNNSGKKSYPASFNNVIGIGHDSNIKSNLFEVNKDKRNIYFSKQSISMGHLGLNECKPGSSFLCPYILGVFCNYAQYYAISTTKENTYDIFLDFIDLLEKSYKYKIFHLFPYNVNNKKVVYYPLDEKNINIIKSYRYMFKEISYYDPTNKQHNSLGLNKYTEIENAIEDADIFVIGDIDYENDKSYAIELIEYISKYNTDILIRYSFINTFKRYILSKERCCNIHCQHL